MKSYSFNSLWVIRHWEFKPSPLPFFCTVLFSDCHQTKIAILRQWSRGAWRDHCFPTFSWFLQKSELEDLKMSFASFFFFFFIEVAKEIQKKWGNQRWLFRGILCVDVQPRWAVHSFSCLSAMLKNSLLGYIFLWILVTFARCKPLLPSDFSFKKRNYSLSNKNIWKRPMASECMCWFNFTPGCRPQLDGRCKWSIFNLSALGVFVEWLASSFLLWFCLFIYYFYYFILFFCAKAKIHCYRFFVAAPKCWNDAH